MQIAEEVRSNSLEILEGRSDDIALIQQILGQGQNIAQVVFTCSHESLEVSTGIAQHRSRRIIGERGIELFDDLVDQVRVQPTQELCQRDGRLSDGPGDGARFCRQLLPVSQVRPAFHGRFDGQVGLTKRGEILDPELAVDGHPDGGGVFELDGDTVGI
ncbi:Uncharacterised protein [Mycobacteroides abscessus subsp. abscessus]|nr:Uncharacterised protein [Mycobacteroides abscessus subsp. abscessus]